MIKVHFTCENQSLFFFNTHKEIEYVPLVGDIITTSSKDFMKATFRVKPWKNDKKSPPSIKDNIPIDFKVVNRKYSLPFNEWELICEPTPDSLLFLLKSIKVRG